MYGIHTSAWLLGYTPATFHDDLMQDKWMMAVRLQWMPTCKGSDVKSLTSYDDTATPFGTTSLT